MCFGDQTTKTESYKADPMTRAAASNNTNFINNLQNQGFQSYTGESVAPLSDMQQSSFGMVNNLANNSTVADATGMINNYANTAAGSVDPKTISSFMDPYMSKYVSMALTPQLAAQDRQFGDQNKGFDANATGAGAFGDTGWGLGRTNLTGMQNDARQGLVGNAYNSAFNTAISAGAQDASNNLQGQTTNASLNEQALGRQLGGAQALQQVGTYGANMANLVNAMGQQQTGQAQAKDNADYQQYLLKQQWGPMMAQLGISNVGALGGALKGTTTTSAPDNSGIAALGSAAGAVAPYLLPLMFSDRRIKDDIDRVGETFDKTPIYTFRYKGDPVLRIGVMAQDVEKKNPDAVHEIGGIKAVDIRKAMAPSANLGRAFGLAA